MSKKVKKKAEEFVPEILDIPEDQIWDYQIEGLAAPHINKPFSKATPKKIAFVVFIVVAILISMYFSVYALLNTGDIEYNEIESGYELRQFSNNGAIFSFDVDYASEIEYLDKSIQLAGTDSADSKFKINKDESKPVTTIHEYAFNCDGTLQVINIGASVTNIDEKAFYSCWALQCIYVDDDNPNYCDIDGVLYNKDMTEIICYPIDHDRYLRLQTGYAHLDENGVQVPDLVDDNGNPMEELWGTTEKYDEKFFDEYNLKVRTYVLPSTVEKVGPLCFNYANLRYIYLPEGLKEIGTLGFFDAGNINALYTYRCDSENFNTSLESLNALGKEVYPSLPEGLEKIGSDAFTKDRGLSYMYIPSSVTFIGHHAFWDAVYKDTGELKGITEMNVASSEEEFGAQTIGSQWLPKYDYMLFKKNIPVNYNADRLPMTDELKQPLA